MRYLTVSRLLGMGLGMALVVCSGITLGVGLLMLNRGTVTW